MSQCCERRTILQHGSILLAGDQNDIVAYMNEPQPYATSGATFEAILGVRPAPLALAGTLAKSFAAALGTRLAPTGLSNDEAVSAAALEAKYADTEWTWRR